MTGILRASVLITALWTAIMVLLRMARFEIPRPQFENAGIAFAIALLVNIVYRMQRETRPPALLETPAPLRTPAPPETPAPLSARKLTLVLPVVPALVAAACFVWALWLGPLADDYVLRAWAAAGRFLPADWLYIRPVPLYLWSLLLGAGAGWPVLHGLNLACHCTTATLLGVLGIRLFNSRLAGVAAGVFFALFPASIEAVGWTAGVFDVLMTLGVVAAAAIFTLSRHGWPSVAALNGLMAVGLLTKETAIALPLLLLGFIPLARRVTNVPIARLARSVLFLSLIAGGYFVARSTVVGKLLLYDAPHSRWQLKNLLIRPYMTLVLPFHRDVSVFISSAAALAIVTLFVTAVRPRHDAKDPRLCGDPGLQNAFLARRAWGEGRDWSRGGGHAHVAILAGLVWILLSALPLLGEFYVGPDLQGSRYAYLLVAGFSLALAGAVDASLSQGYRWPAWLGASAICATWMLAWPVNAASWQAAAATRDALLMDAQQLVIEHGCGALEVQGAPDNTQGAYVFRQGLPEALSVLHYAHHGGPCLATWKSDSLVLIGSER